MKQLIFGFKVKLTKSDADLPEATVSQFAVRFSSCVQGWRFRQLFFSEQPLVRRNGDCYNNQGQQRRNPRSDTYTAQTTTTTCI